MAPKTKKAIKVKASVQLRPNRHANIQIITLYNQEKGQHDVYQSSTCMQLSVHLTMSGGGSVTI